MRQKNDGNTFATMDYTKTGCHMCGQYISLRNGERTHNDRHTNWRKQTEKYKTGAKQGWPQKNNGMKKHRYSEIPTQGKKRREK